MFVDEKTRGEPKPTQVGKAKLSTAIRIGARKRPQARLAYFERGASCAFGAAWEGIGGSYHDPVWGLAGKLMKHFGIAQEVGQAVVRMNDSGESREAIADWLEAQGY